MHRRRILTNISSRCHVSLGRPRRRLRWRAICGPNPRHPHSDDFVAHSGPALGQEVLDITQAQGEARIQPHRMLNGSAWESGNRGRVLLSPGRLAAPRRSCSQTDNPPENVCHCPTNDPQNCRSNLLRGALGDQVPAKRRRADGEGGVMSAVETRLDADTGRARPHAVPAAGWPQAYRRPTARRLCSRRSTTGRQAGQVAGAGMAVAADAR